MDAIPGVRQLVSLGLSVPKSWIFTHHVFKWLNTDLNHVMSFIFVLGTLAATWTYISHHIRSNIQQHFMSSIQIRANDEVYSVLMRWVAHQSFAQKARRTVVAANLNSRFWYLWSWDNDDEDEIVNYDDQEDAFEYTPSFGSHYFWYHHKLIIFKRDLRDNNLTLPINEREETSICCFGRNPNVLKQLLQEARRFDMRKDQAKTMIYRGVLKPNTTESSWQRCSARPNRPFSTILLPEATKQDIVTDITEYLQPATKRWYSDRGIPWRRGYMLCGPPGTGKSSLSFALAGLFKLRLYILPLSSLGANEENISSLFMDLPNRCIVLLEDVDAINITNAREKLPAKNKDDITSPRIAAVSSDSSTYQTSSRLSLSSLLNILDGVGSQEGRILIMTTNHLEKLDKALVRPGRVDKIIEFDLADNEIANAMFKSMYRKASESAGTSSVLNTSIEKENPKLSELAAEFSRRIPPHRFSPAELQGFLLKYKNNPNEAVSMVHRLTDEI